MIKSGLIKELEDYKYDYQYLEEKLKEVDNLKDRIDKVYDRLKLLKGHSITVNDLDTELQSILKKQAVEEESLVKLIMKKKEIEDKINLLQQPYKTIFYLKYIRMHSIYEIASKMCYSSKRIYQLHSEGVALYNLICNKDSNK